MKTAVGALKDGNLVDVCQLALRRQVFLTVSPNVKCEGIRKFFRPKGNKSLLLPSKFEGSGMATYHRPTRVNFDRIKEFQVPNVTITASL